MLSLTLYQRKLLLRSVMFGYIRLRLASEYSLPCAPTDVYQTLFSGFLSLLVFRTVFLIRTSGFRFRFRFRSGHCVSDFELGLSFFSFGYGLGLASDYNCKK